MRELLVNRRLGKLSDQGGWVMMDAVWSSVVVVLAFMATFMALENGTKTANRDLARTAAYDVAQDEISGLRDLGKRDLNALLAKNNPVAPPSSPSKTVTLNGVDYDVWYSAYYVTGLGNNSTDACGGTYAANGNGTAKFIYIKVVVTYDGISTTAPYPSLDEYFAPEGGDTNAATGTLRVYLLNRNLSPYVGTSVALTATDPGMNYTTQTATTGASGCVLFTGLPRGSYNIGITTSKYDMYLNNVSAALLNVPVKLPDRAAISKDIKMESPLKLNLDWYVNNSSGVAQQITPTTSTTTGPNALIGPSVGRSSQILNTSGTDFTTLPGTSFSPHTWLPSYAQNYMYPDPNGYDIFAGPCDVNIPATGATHVPSTGNTTWGPGQTYLEGGSNFRFTVPRLDTKIYIGDRTDGTLLKDKAIRQCGTFPTCGGRELIRLVGADGATGPVSSANCGPRANLFNNWIRMKGTFYTPIISSTVVPVTSLPDDAEALPWGKYDICLSAYVSGTRRSTTSGAGSTWTAFAETRYRLFNDVDINQNTTINWDPFVDSYTTTDCAAGATWSP